MSTLNTRVRFHSDRAECFKRHASNTRNPQTREMYLRLTLIEMALAAKEAELVEQTEQQAPREDQDAAPTTPGESPLPISDEN